MKIECIFANTYGSLHSIKFKGESQDEFNRLFDLWSNTEYLFDFCKQNERAIFSGYYQISRLEEFIEKIKNEAFSFEDMFINYFNNTGIVHSLGQIFSSYHDQQYAVSVLQLSKAKVIGHGISKRALRLYGLRLGDNDFIITGGCIKTTVAVQDCPYNLAEISKMKIVRDYLKSINIETQDDLIYFYEE